MKLSRRDICIGLAMATLIAMPAAAQNYPSKTIRIVVPFTPGGGVDLIGRTIAQKLGEAWSQTVVVDNRPGGNGNNGANLVAKAPPDGYMLLVGSNPLTVSPSLTGNLPFDPIKDLAAITLAASAPNLLIAGASVPANSVKEMVALAKAKPGTLTYASGTTGNTGHMVGELLKTTAQINITHVPYKGNPEALNDVIGGQVQFMFSAPAAVMQQIRAGRVKVLAVTSTTRYQGLPDVPTFAEAGFPGVEAMAWYGMLTTAGTPKDVIAKLNAEIVRILNQPDVKTKLAATGYDVATDTPEQFGEMLRNDFLTWQKVVKQTGMHVD